MKRRYMPVVVVCLLIFVLAVAGGITFVIQRYMPSKESMDMYEYYGQPSEGEAVLTLGTQKMEERALMVESRPTFRWRR